MLNDSFYILLQLIINHFNIISFFFLSIQWNTPNRATSENITHTHSHLVRKFILHKQKWKTVHIYFFFRQKKEEERNKENKRKANKFKKKIKNGKPTFSKVWISELIRETIRGRFAMLRSCLSSSKSSTKSSAISAFWVTRA